MRNEWIRLSDSRKRTSFLLAGIIAVLSIYAVRLIQLQVFQGSALSAQATHERQRTIELPAIRGSIVDANNQPLAVTVDAVNVTADQTLITNPQAEAQQLAGVLGADPAALATRLTGRRRFIYVAKGLTPQTWSQIATLNLPGIVKESTTKRVYPNGDLAANVVGFVGSDGKGLGGLEYGLQPLLAGTNGTQTFQRGPGGGAIPTAPNTKVAAIPGSTVKLTINSDIQYAAQQAIAAEVATTKATSGTVVVMDPTTGKVLALATAPTFDPNNVGASSAGDRGNRALSDVYEPGSTAKTMTAAAVINQGLANPYTPITIPGTLKRGNKVFHDDVAHGTWQLTLTGMMAKTSNLGANLTSERICPRIFDSYLQKFGMGQPTGLNFPGESTGKLPSLNSWSSTTFPTLAFGQGMNVNTVQAASVYATIANNGTRITPTLVDQIVAPDGTITHPNTVTSTQVVTPKTAKTVRLMLETVVSNRGTAPLAQIPGYRVAGKTGTAQYADPKCGCYRGVVASFIGMAPADAPRLVVAVTLVKPRNGHFGGQVAAPVFKQVMISALQTLHIPPTGTTAPQLPTTFGAGG